MHWILGFLRGTADLFIEAVAGLKFRFAPLRLYEIIFLFASVVLTAGATYWGLHQVLGGARLRAMASPAKIEAVDPPKDGLKLRTPSVLPGTTAGAAADTSPPKPPEPKPTHWRPVNCKEPARTEPSRFRNGQRMPTQSESASSVGIDDVSFKAGKDLIRIDDNRVWWESDHDGDTDDEDDHLFHHAMEKPMCRLIELTLARGGRLRVTDAYRPHGVHSRKSLHKQGRAVDCTWENPDRLDANGRPVRLPLATLAKICWAAGFDWVYFEKDHIHASVRPDHGEE